MPLCYFYVALGTTQKQMSKVIGQKATSPLHNTYTLRWARTLPLKSASSVEYRAHTSLLPKWRVRWFSRFCTAYVLVCPTHIDHATCDIHRKGPHSTCCIQGMRPNNITKWISHELFAFMFLLQCCLDRLRVVISLSVVQCLLPTQERPLQNCHRTGEPEILKSLPGSFCITTVLVVGVGPVHM